MADPEIVDDVLQSETSLTGQANYRSGVIHFTLPIGNGREIRRSLQQTVRGNFWLPIPERIQDEKTPVRFQGRPRQLQNFQNIVFTEANEKLAHPHRLKTRRQSGM